MQKFLLFILFTCCFYYSHAQSTSSGKLKIFLECFGSGCDDDYFRTEIKIIDFVLDRLAADVHVLINSTESGSGGRMVQVIFYGQNVYIKQTDTLAFPLKANATPFENRMEVAKRIKIGLLPFLIQSPYVSFIEIDMSKDKSENEIEQQKEKVLDKWNYWVFKIGSDGNFDTDQVYSSTRLSGYLSANRTTDKIKINFTISSGFNKSTYKYENDNQTEEYQVKNSDYQLSHYLVKSIAHRWSLGYQANLDNNTFSNIKSRALFRPAIEYAIYPYSEVNSKFFTLNYGFEVKDINYYDTTIYNKISEVLWSHNVRANLALKQKWGYINSSVNYSKIFKKGKYDNLSVSLDINIRITGGLSLFMYSYGGLVHDQLYLVKGKATEQDILTRRRQLASSYNFYSGVGLNYRFGSMLNNFVNPRFSNL